MNTSLAWLREFVPTRTTPAVLGEKFRMTSSELESLIDWKDRFDGLIIGHVLSVKPHPNADRLRIASVDVGDKKRTIVCGAPNLAEGQYVVVATPGTTIAPVGKPPFTIEEATIREVKSEGMLCALEEIGVAIPSDGIFTLDQTCKPGTPAAEALFENDTVLDLEITPNRPDLLSHFGLAREVSAFEQHKLTPPPVAALEAHRQYPVQIRLELTNHKECQRLTGIALDITVQPSPWWLQSRLIRSGVRPINNIVDVTNYVMLELGQPMHAFDLDKLAKQGQEHVLGVRLANPKESLALLDGTSRELSSEDVVVTDANDQAISLAGIMGGAATEISESTTRVFLEAGVWYPHHIRRTSRRLALRSEASLRFEKGLDTEQTDKAIKRAVFLLQDISDAKVMSKLIDSRVHAPVRPHIHVSFEEINRVLGVRISAADCKEILHQLGFELKDFTKSGFTVTPPSWRRDIALTEDIIEELIRIWGYDRLPSTLPIGAVKPPKENQSVARKRTIRHALAAAGYHENVHQAFSSEQSIRRLGLDPKDCLPLPNPLSAETAILNPTHLVGMLADCGSVNIDQPELLLFEIGKVFRPPSREQERLTLLVRTNDNAESAVRRLKSAITRMTQVASLPEPIYTAGSGLPYAESGHTLDISVAGTVVGQLCLMSSSVVAANKIRRGRELVAAEINLDTLLSLPTTAKTYHPASTYPSSARDLTVTIPKHIPLQQIIDTAAKAINTAIVPQWGISTIYSGKPLPETDHAVTLSLTYNAADRTLSDEEIKQHHAALEKALDNLVKG